MEDVTLESAGANQKSRMWGGRMDPSGKGNNGGDFGVSLKAR